jgi:predicted secreted protein
VAEDIPIFDSSHDNARVELAAGTVFEVALPEQPGTGFKWKIVSGQTPVADFRDPAGPDRGAGTTRHFRFQAEQQGESTLSLQLRRGWERDQPPAKEFKINLVVR